jgi:hypothetical protein
MSLYDLRATVVNLRAIGGLATCQFYDSESGIIHLRIEDPRIPVDYVTVDINTGLVNLSSEAASALWVQEPKNGSEQLFDRIDYKAFKRRVQAIDDLAVKLAISLLTHQVRGEHITQGLRASKLNYNVKIKEDYLGGWLITTNNDERVGADILLNTVIRRKQTTE